MGLHGCVCFCPALQVPGFYKRPVATRFLPLFINQHLSTRRRSAPHEASGSDADLGCLLRWEGFIPCYPERLNFAYVCPLDQETTKLMALACLPVSVYVLWQYLSDILVWLYFKHIQKCFMYQYFVWSRVGELRTGAHNSLEVPLLV